MARAVRVGPVSINRETGRRHVVDPEAAKAAYLEALPEYFTVTAALAKANVPMSQLRKWRELDGGFLVAEQDARNQLADRLEMEAIRRAFHGVKTPVYQGGLLAGHIQIFSDNLLMLMLKAVRPDKFRERSEVTVTQPIVKVVAGFEAAEVL